MGNEEKSERWTGSKIEKANKRPGTGDVAQWQRACQARTGTWALSLVSRRKNKEKNLKKQMKRRMDFVAMKPSEQNKTVDGQRLNPN